MNFSPSTLIDPQQAKLNDLMARLSKIAENPLELLEYLGQHASVLGEFLPLKGYSYEIISGAGIQRMRVENIESLQLQEHPDQAAAFQKAVYQVVETKKPVYLPVGMPVDSGLHGLQVLDAPVPREVPPFNQTQFDHYFVPIFWGEQLYGVLHVWMLPDPEHKAQARLAILTEAARGIQLYLKARKAFDISQEVVRLHGYSTFLESISGSMGLGDVTSALVSYVRELVKCDRVTLYAAKDYRQVLDVGAENFNTQFKYEYVAESGLKSVNPDSAEGKVMFAVGEDLLKATIEKIKQMNWQEAKAPGAAPASTSVLALRPPVPGQRQAIQWISFTRGSEENEIKESENVGEYWQLAPMNWVTLVPLFDEQFQVCAFLLIEGKDKADVAKEVLLKSYDLCFAAGQALSIALFWHKRTELQMAQRWIQWKDATLNTARRRSVFWWLMVFAPLLILMLYPKKFFIKADAQVRPTHLLFVPAETTARIINIPVHEGETVNEGQVLIELDTNELELNLRQQENEYLRSLTEADRAQNENDELAMQTARLTAQKAEAQVENLRYQLDHAILKAPFNGMVIGPKNLYEREGTVAQVGEVLIEMAQLEDWEVRAKLREQDLAYLAKRLERKKDVRARLKLTADPSKTYELHLNNPAQLMYGLEADLMKGNYLFAVVLPFDVTDPQVKEFLKAGFGGRIAFDMGYRPLGYVLLRDAYLYVRINWF